MSIITKISGKYTKKIEKDVMDEVKKLYPDLVKELDELGFKLEKPDPEDIYTGPCWFLLCNELSITLWLDLATDEHVFTVVAEHDSSSFYSEDDYDNVNNALEQIKKYVNAKVQTVTYKVKFEALMVNNDALPSFDNMYDVLNNNFDIPYEIEKIKENKNGK